MVGDGRLYLVLCILLVLGLGVPASLYLTARRGQGLEQIELLKRAAKRARNPWQAEDDRLDKLARKVDELRPKEEKPS